MATKMKNNTNALRSLSLAKSILNKGIGSKRARDILTHIVKNGTINSIQIQNDYKVLHPPRAISEIKELGLQLVCNWVNSKDGKRIAGYRLPTDSEFEEFTKRELEKKKVTSIEMFLRSVQLIKSDYTDSHLYYFRGHSNAESYSIKPSIFRKKSWIEQENILLKEMQIKCPDELIGIKSTFELLVKLQHYSLPTRLLDISENPLVALYFACRGSKDHDGEVIVFKVPKNEIRYFDSDTVSVISNIAKRPSDFGRKIRHLKSCERFSKQSDILYLLHDIRDEKPQFEGKIKQEHLHSVVCVKPRLNNPRIIRQDGAFFLFGMGTHKREPAEFPDSMKVSNGSKRIIISSTVKAELIDKLDQMGISESKLFPEIDKVAQYLLEKLRLNEKVP